MITVLKASAGSGKTYNLAKTYLRMLLSSGDERAYRHILAVTFTNKATDEMKGRILKELHILATDPSSSPYIEEFSRDFGGEARVSKIAGKILVNILHDYSAFSVSTIDKFFQQTLRAFAREIGQFASYQVELDKDSLLEESVDNVIDSVTENNPKLRSWLAALAMFQLENYGSSDLRGDLVDIAKSLLGDEFRQMAQEAGKDMDCMYSKENIAKMRSLCEKMRKNFISLLNGKAQDILDLIDSKGLAVKDFYGGFLKSIVPYATIRLKDKVCAPTEAFQRKLSDSSSWFTKANAKKYLPLVEGVLEEAAERFLDLFDAPFKAFNTAGIIEKQLYSLGLASEIRESFAALLKEKNVLSIDDSNSILKRIIGGCDTPFIYEKLGVRFTNFLLDEFQDTSQIQWENFEPLLKESEATGNDNLVVGDVKQSIYRWRGSKWDLLSSKVKQDFPSCDDSVSLDENWRSCREVVEFNNEFFRFAADLMDALLGEGKPVGTIYSDVKQTSRSKDFNPGAVRLTFCSGENELEEVYKSVMDVLSRGASKSDIAVLARTNNNGADVASYLVEKGIPVISDDSLKVKSCDSVRLLVGLLSLADNPADSVGDYISGELGIGIPTNYLSIEDLCESLLRSMKEKDPEKIDAHALYLQAFLDKVQEWTGKNGNSLSGFLNYWKGEDPAIASPRGADAVRIITIHKAKGLEFPYVIFPFVESVSLWKSNERWVDLDPKDTPLADMERGLFWVSLSGATSNTFFEHAYRNESLNQLIDAINLGYVAMTRPEKELHVISQRCSSSDLDKLLEALSTSSATREEKIEALSKLKYPNLAKMLYAYARLGIDPDLSPVVSTLPENEEAEGREDAADVEEWKRGTPYDFSSLERKSDEFTDIPSSFQSYPVGLDPDAETNTAPRIRLSSQALDYFDDEGLKWGADASIRLKGILLHSILSEVKMPSDLDEAVNSAVMDGSLSPEMAADYKSLLSEKISSVQGYGFFPADARDVWNEMDILDSHGGDVFRPDRVVFDREGGVTVIDFKFGKREKPSYFSQVRSYMDLFSRMGHEKVKGYIWYISTGDAGMKDKIVPVL